MDAARFLVSRPVGVGVAPVDSNSLNPPTDSLLIFESIVDLAEDAAARIGEESCWEGVEEGSGVMTIAVMLTDLVQTGKQQEKRGTRLTTDSGV
jgi:hypothetical protein